MWCLCVHRCRTSNLHRILMLLAIYFAVGALAADCGSGAATNQCTPNKCESVGDAQICTSCVAGNVPINGVCKARDGNKEVTNAGCKKASANEAGDQTCGKCEGDIYFLYKGGCYSIGDTTGQELCTTAATEGVCTVAATGYFAVPGATKMDQSVVACGDATTGVTIGGSFFMPE